MLFTFSILALFIMTTLQSCKNKTEEIKIPEPKIVLEPYQTTFDSTSVTSFFKTHPLLQKYEADVKKLYQKHQYHYVWFDKKGINEFANLLYDKTNNLEEEGVEINVPYKTKFDQIHSNLNKNTKPNIETELLHSSLYFLYVMNVYNGLDSDKSKEVEWYIPRKQQSYVSYLDSLLTDPSLLNKEEKNLFPQSGTFTIRS